MLTGAGFGDDPLLAHPPGQEHLAQGIVDLVGAGVTEILPLQPDLRSARSLGQAIGTVHRCRPATKAFGELIEFLAEGSVALGGFERGS